MVYKAVESQQNPAAMPPQTASFAPSANIVFGVRAVLTVGRAAVARPLAGAVRRPGAGAGRGKARHRGRAAGGARLLGPAAAAGPAGSVAPDRDPVSDRDRLSAVQFYRSRRQPGRLQRRSGAADSATRSRSPAPSRCGGSRRCSMRSSSNRGDAIIASLAVTPQMRARLDFTDPYYRAPARFVSRRDAVMRGGSSGISRGQEGRRHRRLLARGLSEGDVHRRRAALLSQ